MKLWIKNVSRGIEFFMPLNRYLKPNESIDVLAMCEGSVELARKIVFSYLNDPSFQVFDSCHLFGNIPVASEKPVGHLNTPVIVVAQEKPQEEATVVQDEAKLNLEKALKRRRKREESEVLVQNIEEEPKQGTLQEGELLIEHPVQGESNDTTTDS